MPHGPDNGGMAQPQFFPEFPLQCGLRGLAMLDTATWASPETTIDAKPVPLEVHEKDIRLLIEYQSSGGLPKTNRTHSWSVNTLRATVDTSDETNPGFATVGAFCPVTGSLTEAS